ncbi:MAG: tRNA uridine-5-carboxymethylaminomethyl(34) synthesis GTPase MnmE [Hyphomicrobiales bacterium]|nr:tRNA uridine-5-carboxymethylaminomethyl(34) synthesis GTPase MnmE [Hyphomicrobiales bacterium]
MRPPGDTATIYALATPAGRSAVAVVRISGSQTRALIEQLTGHAAPPPRRAALRVLRSLDGVEIDQGLVTYFPAPHSYTGEDCAEFGLHGGRAVIAAMVQALSSGGLARQAEPGEFTQRAFLAGKLDLTQAEGIADLIDSETEYQRRQALRVVGGGLSARLGDWRNGLISLSAALEAQLDFSDEGDVGDAALGELIRDCNELASAIQAEVAKGARSRRMREGFTVVIAGPPNAGKSSLYNALIGREAAIVSDVPGTTRDLLSARLDFNGALITLIDSAGQRPSADPIERIGVGRAKAAVESADLVLWLNAPGLSEPGPAGSLAIWSKSDLQPPPAGGGMPISVATGDGLQALENAVHAAAVAATGDGSDGLLIRERHEAALRACVDSIEQAREQIAVGRYELAAEDLRSALHALGRLAGRVDVEDVLGEIFGRFCIGK